MDDHSYIHIKDDCFHNLAPEEIVEILENAASLYKDKISNVPPVRPIEGQYFCLTVVQINVHGRSGRSK